MEQRKKFSGWNVAAGSFLVMATPFAIVFLAHSIFMPYVVKGLNITATQFSLVFTIVAIATALTSPIMGKLVRQKDIRYIMAISGAVVSIAFGALGLATELWQLYVLSAIIGVSATGITQIPISNIVTNWFPSKKKGVATGFVFAGGNVGAFLVILTISNLIPKIGYEKCYFILGGIMLVVTVLVSLFVIKGKPSDVGQLPYGVNENSVNSTDGRKAQDLDGYTFKEAKAKPVFWVFIVAIILLGCVFAGVQMHIPNYLQSIGYSDTLTSNITSIRYIVGIASNIVVGMILEKLGLKSGLAVIGVFMVIAVGSLLFSNVVAFSIIFAILFGLFTGIATMGPSYLTSEMFGKKDYGTILGIVMMFFQFGGAIGPTISGFIYDVTGAYKITWMIFVVLLVITFGTFLGAIKLQNNKKQTKNIKKQTA